MPYEAIHFCTKPDGSYVELGSGGFGTVSVRTPHRLLRVKGRMQGGYHFKCALFPRIVCAEHAAHDMHVARRCTASCWTLSSPMRQRCWTLDMARRCKMPSCRQALLCTLCALCT